MSRKRLAGRFLRTTMLSGAAAAAAMPAFAQDGDAEDTIVVSGTRIQRDDLNAPSPVTTVSSEQLVLTNTVNSEQFLNTLPQVIPSFDQTSNNPGDGSARVNLRGLGTRRTLVLVDGARFVGLGPSFIVDLNNIPSALVERVDVVTGGASAVYGSDAVAGVVNFILKKDFEGIQLDASHELSAAGWDANQTNIAITAGGNFADGRGNAVVFASYTNREALFQGDRVASQLSFFDPGPGGTTFIEGGSSNIPEVRFRGRTSSNFNSDPSVQDPLCGAGNANSCFGFFNAGGSGTTGDIRGLRFGGAGGVTDLYNYAPANYLQLPQERYNITASATYQINDHIEAYMRGVFSETVVDSQLAPTPTGAIPVVINLDNPAIPADLLAIITADVAVPDNPATTTIDESRSGSNNLDGTANIRFHKRFEELGTRNSLRDTTGFQILTGIRGDLNDQWSYDTFFNFSRSTVSQIQSGNVSTSAIQAAVLCDTGPTAVASGCTAPYLDIFGGAGGFSPAATAFVGRTGAQIDEIEQLQWVGTLSGDLDSIRTPWAESGAALVLGLEYRENFARSVPDSVLGPDVRGFNSSLPVAGRYDVYEVFGEVQMPLITGQALIESLVLNGAYRYSDYSIANVGGTHTFAAGLDWEPIDGMRFRGQFQRAVRAPNIGELFAAFTNGFPGAADPCSSGANGSFSPATITSTCIATGVPAGNVGAAFQSNGQIQGLFGGNPNLFQETADTLTIGLVWQPEMVDGLSLQVDYYDIEIKDAITVIPLQTVLNECHISNIAASCAVLTGARDPASGEIGTLPFVPNLGSINAANVKARGIDVNIGYSMDAFAGSMTWQYYGNYTIDSSFQSSATSPVVECDGAYGLACGEPTPKYKHTVQVGYNQGPFTASVRWRAIGAVTADASTLPTVSTLSDDIGFTNYIDVTTQYAVNEHLDLTVGVRNITGKDVPILGSTASEQGNTWPATYTPFGRQLFFGASLRF